MVSLWKSPLQLILLMAAGVIGAAGATTMARPGTLNYAEGSVTLAGQSVGVSQFGQTEVAPGQVLRTGQGKAEMLLTPGVYLRIGDQSAVRMVNPSLTDTRVELLRGKAIVEAAQVRKENRIDVVDKGFNTILEKKGIYAFNADQPSVAVFDGQAKVQMDDRNIEVKKGKEFAFGVDVKPQKFDRDNTGDLYAWSKLRSEYLAEANEDTVQRIVLGGPAWYGAGWYWAPGYSTWAFVPGYGYLDSPFGYGFYSPTYWYSMGPGYYRTPYYNRPAYRPSFRPAPGRVWGGGGEFNRGGVPRGGVPHAPAGRSLGRGARM